MRVVILGIMLFYASTFLSHAQSFEGQFVAQIMDDGSIARMRFMVKGSKVIIEPIDAALAKPIRMLLEKGSDKIYLLTEEQGMKLAILTVVAAQTNTSIEKNSKFSSHETGKTKKIGIYECKQVIVDNGDGQKLDMWVTPDMGFTLALLFENIGRLNAESYVELTKNNREELYMKNMALEINELKEGSTTQITIREIEPKKLDDEVFSIQGYSVVDMKTMMGGE